MFHSDLDQGSERVLPHLVAAAHLSKLNLSTYMHLIHRYTNCDFPFMDYF